mmetsp:Transcript_85166/g.214782  ORF Transcript_85166/g.214782 Transcript_85166/m.214782 type:complete len:84 (-) Transcript_85166:1-252(-)
MCSAAQRVELQNCTAWASRMSSAVQECFRAGLASMRCSGRLALRWCARHGASHESSASWRWLVQSRGRRFTLVRYNAEEVRTL